MTDTLENIEFTYDSQKRKHPAVEELLDIIQYRDMIFQFVRRDIIARYKRSVLGVFWTMLQPLGMMIVMTIIFSQLFNRVEGYAAYLLSGLISWTFFAQTTTAALQQVASSGSLGRRIYMPHTAFVVSSVMTGMVNLTISIRPLTLITLIVGKPITWAILFTPFSILILSAFALGIGLFLSTAVVFFPDIREMYQILLQAWMYFTPIIYPETILPEAYRFWILRLNPMYYMISLFRDPVYNGRLPSLDVLITSVVIAVIMLTAGWIYFSKQADSFAYKA
jgi:ABC-type polysaccharide/polyol phosphate export permease